MKSSPEDVNMEASGLPGLRDWVMNIHVPVQGGQGIPKKVVERW